MILNALLDYYESLARQGKIARPGWSSVKVSFALSLGENGNLLGVVPLKNKEVLVSPFMRVPSPVKRTVNPSANFLCDNSAYILGIDKKGKKDRTAKCFNLCRELHLSLLQGLDSVSARGITLFFKTWDPDGADRSDVLRPFIEEIMEGSNLVFMVNNSYAHEDPEIASAWRQHYLQTADGPEMQCLVTGKFSPPVLLHPSIKGVRGAQSSGASLVSFNARAFESYGHDDGQGQNAPVSEYAAFAYGSALNYLTSDSKHLLMIGDTTVVFWAANGEAAYQDAFSAFLSGEAENGSVSDADLSAVLTNLAKGLPVDWNNIPLNPANQFYILGLAPNAARLSVRFFLQGEFGSMVTNLKLHYDRISISKPQWDNWDIVPIWKLLGETVNQNSRDKTPSPHLAGDTFRAIMTNSRYPETLYNGVELRIRADRKITRGRAAIIKAYLIRNIGIEEMKEVLTLELNEQSTYQPYVLGRLFSVLEQVQQAANPGLNSTIRDKYFNSACATPAVIFPLLIKLSGSHLRKLDTGFRIHCERQITELMGKMSSDYPVRLNLPQQGAFQLGYYHQTQKRFEKKNNTKEEKENV